MIQTLLIANRGEIACRIIRTAKRLNIKTIAIYSTPDKNSLAVNMADEAFWVGEAEAKNSYLQMDPILDIAKKTHADAIHPGYGFLSENAQFADKIKQANLLFIGPSSEAIRAMGDKATSKQLMMQANIPCLSGYEESIPNNETLIQNIQTLSYPLLIKASAGGGGKGMRIVHDHQDLLIQLNNARREAMNSFSDDRLIIEPFLMNARHVEVQVFFDQQGQGLYLFDRDCSIQRRYQKIIEEAPAFNLDQKTHQAIGECALKVAKTVAYQGAGTVEFLMDSQHHFYFMEMNTRLQVEHPVTEMITQIDLVEWQLRIAMGLPLPTTQAQLQHTGCAVEARIYAENTRKDFLPTSGRLDHVSWPEHMPNIRIDTGVTSLDEVTPWYDPMLAKIIAWGETRQAAYQQLLKALQKTELVGLETNRDFLIQLLNHPDIQSGNINTAWLESHLTQMKYEQNASFYAGVAAATFSLLFSNNTPMTAWRLNQTQTGQCIRAIQNQPYHLKLTKKDTIWEFQMNDVILHYTQIHLTSTQCIQIQDAINSTTRTCSIVMHQSNITVITDQHTITLEQPNYEMMKASPQHALSAPMNGRVTSVQIQPDTQVKQNDILMTLEAMKMEINIKAPKAGYIKNILFSPGDSVHEGDLLLAYDETIP
ncbi:MAG: ATP-grasp domain-containing protein [Endozoicomonadaceae bacterium]|nr:ATP-grasp domain-containing protein [Endozoicomonadaceae bacterium]MBE8233214.1 ATP-grasp domain-containing protein [Endozoicomonadaceae bacterium]